MRRIGQIDRGERTREPAQEKLTLDRAALECDRRLVEVSERLEFLLHVTPVDMEEAWRRFAAAGCPTDDGAEPRFSYRELAYDPAELEAELDAAPIDDVEHPTVAELLSEKCDELRVKLEMLGSRNTRRFLAGSLKVYGGVEDDLVELAEELLARLPDDARAEPVEGRLDAAAFAERAERELAHYRELRPDFPARVEVSEDVPPSLMVSGDRLLIGSAVHIPERRAEALIQHEVGTHLVTRFNGSQQPLRLLGCGLAGYDTLQEGLAVLAEYLVGGLRPGRLRTLAARVVAADSLTSGDPFPETFRVLHEDFHLADHLAFTVTARVHRSGGLTKDAVYLRGLDALLPYLAMEDEDGLEPLLVGKVDLFHAPAVRQLLELELLAPPALTPRFLTGGGPVDGELPERLAFVRSGITPLDLLDGGVP